MVEGDEEVDGCGCKAGVGVGVGVGVGENLTLLIAGDVLELDLVAEGIGEDVSQVANRLGGIAGEFTGRLS
ncbi:hypothetical protein [Rhodococcus aetherivorans]